MTKLVWLLLMGWLSVAPVAGVQAAPPEPGTLDGPYGDVRVGGFVDFDVTWRRNVQYPALHFECQQDGVVRYAHNVEPVEGNGAATVDIGIPGAYWWQPDGGTITCLAELNEYIVQWHPVVLVRRIDQLDAIEFDLPW